MIIAKHNYSNHISAYADYDIVDKDGSSNSYGEYAFVRYMWVHEFCRRDNLIRYFIKQALEKHPNLKYVYFHRKKYNDRMRMYKLKEF